MLRCNLEDFNDLVLFPHLRIKPEKLIVKIYNDKEFQKSIIVPTDYYPVNAKDIDVFCDNNTEFVTDERILKAFNDTPYKLGHCYTNSDTLAKNLKKEGFYNFQIYSGWCFVGETLPIHHCWIVANEKQILDLSADNIRFLEWLSHQPKPEAGEIDALRNRRVEYMAMQQKMSNIERCGGVGKADWKIYIGASIESGEAARCEYNDLLREYPHHEITHNLVTADGKNRLFVKMEEAGYLD